MTRSGSIRAMPWPWSPEPTTLSRFCSAMLGEQLGGSIGVQHGAEQCRGVICNDTPVLMQAIGRNPLSKRFGLCGRQGGFASGPLKSGFDVVACT